MERAPHPALAGLVRSIWLNGAGTQPAPATSAREWMMPTGQMHLVLRLAGPAIGVFDHPADSDPRNMGHAVINGARASMYVKAVSADSASIGVRLRPGAAQALLGLPAYALAGQHVGLDDVWGPAANLMREQLLAMTSPQDTLRCFEMLLLQRLKDQSGVASRSAHPAVLMGLGQLPAGASVEEVARHSGYSQRQFSRLFSEAVGLAPRVYTRVRRFQKALNLMQSPWAARLSDVACDAGYSDQPHFNRDFRAFSGMTPEQYRAARPVAVNHVPVAAPPTCRGDVHFVQDRPPGTA